MTTPTEHFFLERVRQFNVVKNAARFEVEAGSRSVFVEIAIWGHGIVRYRMLPEGRLDEDRFDLLAPDWKPALRTPNAFQDQGRVTLEAYDTIVEVNEDPWCVSVGLNGRTKVVWERPLDIDARNNRLSLPTGFDVMDEKVTRCRFTTNLDPYERIYGLGEKHTGLNKRGQRIVSWNRNAYGAGSELAYKNVPFMVSSKGYGLFLNDTRRSTWDLGSSSNFASTVEVEGPGLDLFVLLGERMQDVLSAYADVTGHASLPPRWSFGVWISPFGKHLTMKEMDQSAILELAREIRERDLPCDVLHLDPFWMGDEGYCDFEWGRERFPDPSAMVQTLLQQGFKLCLWEHPYVDKDTDMYREGAEKGYFLKKADGSVYVANLGIQAPAKHDEYVEGHYEPAGIVDFSNPEASEWYKEKHRPLLESGVAVFKTDFGEEIPEDAYFSNGKTGAEMHNAYPLLYNRAVYEVTGEYTDRPLVWGRAGFAGIQRTPVQWSGDPLPDFESLASTIRAGLSYGMSGVPFWGFDLGGFRGRPTKEAYVRWVQVGLLVSHSRFHGTAPRLPWNYGEDVLRIVRNFVKLRYSLLPYIYAVSHEAVTTGVPVMRPLALEFPDDPGSAATELQYMLGPYFMIAPVLNPEGRVSIYLPPGNWYDGWTSQEIQGPTVLKRTVRLESLPIFIRSNAILPTVEASRTVPKHWDPVTFDIYPDSNGAIEIAEEGEDETTIVRVTRGETLGITAKGAWRKWRFRLMHVDKPEAVELTSDGHNTSWYDAKARRLDIDFDSCEELTVTVHS